MTATVKAAWERVPNGVKVDGLLWPLLAIGWVAAFAAGMLYHAPTFTRTVHDSPSVQAALAGKTGAQIAAALGRPDQTVAGAAVSPALKGLTCGVWRSRVVIVCWK